MLIRRYRSWLPALIMTACVAVSTVGAEERAPQEVAPGVEKPLRISPRPGNARNSEGDFIQLKDGRLLLIFTKFVGGSDHAPAELMSRFSTDGGKTWSEEDVPVLKRKPGQANLMSVSLLRLQDGRIALFYIEKYKSPSGSGYPLFDHLLMRTSDDEGATWSEPTHVIPKDQPGYYVLNNDRVIQLKSGRLVAPVAVHYLPEWDKWRSSAQIVCYLSDDQGKTWRASTSKLDSKLLAQEPGVVELKNNDELLMFARSNDCQLVSHSKDGGETWSPLKRSNIKQPSVSPASIERIPSTGDLLLVWNNGDGPLKDVMPKGRRPFTAAISKDEGVTWEHVQNIGADPQGWYCYTAIEFVDDHVLLAHCEYPRLNSLQVTRMPVSWLYESSEKEAESEPIKAGIIGIDAHALPWTKILNDPEAKGELADMVVVAGFPGGSPDIPQSMKLREAQVGPVAELGVEIVDSIDELISKVDVVMVLSIDGRKHLEQARPVFAARKPIYIDKPIAGSLSDAIKIFQLAEEHKVPCFSSSSLRFAKQTAEVRDDPRLGKLIGCDQYAPCSLEPHHPDFFWYGIHGVEPLFTIMGSGCESVTRVHTEGTDMAVGVWKDGRIGSFRGIRDGKRGYGSTVFGSKAILPGGGFEGYEPLIVEIIRFFKTGKAPVSAEETLEIFAFMEAADESKRQGGVPVTLESVMQKARQVATGKQASASE